MDEQTNVFVSDEAKKSTENSTTIVAEQEIFQVSSTQLFNILFLAKILM